MRRVPLMFALCAFLISLPAPALAQVPPLVLQPRVAAPPPPAVQQEPSERDKQIQTKFLDICNYFVQTPPKAAFGSEATYWLTFLTTVDPPVTVAAFRKANPGVDPPVTGRYSLTWALGACAQRYAIRARAIGDADGAEGHRELVQLDFNVARLKTWFGKAVKATQSDADAADATAARTHIENALLDLHAFMSDHGLLNPFSAGAFFGTAIGASGLILSGGSDAVKNRISETEQTLPLTTLTVESTHFGWRGEHGADASFRAHVGFRPVLNVVKASLDQDTADSTPALVAVLQPALFTDVGARVGLPLERINGEFSFTAIVGASRITTDPVTFDDKKPALIATRMSDRASKTAWFSEAGVELMMFDNFLRVLHAEKGLVTPVVRIAAGYRVDSRFAQENMPGLVADPHRLYFRSMVDLNKLVAGRAFGDPAKAFDFGFGIEYDRSLHASSDVPSSTRFLIRGDINLLKAAKKDDSAAKEKSAAAAGAQEKKQDNAEKKGAQ